MQGVGEEHREERRCHESLTTVMDGFACNFWLYKLRPDGSSPITRRSSTEEPCAHEELGEAACCGKKCLVNAFSGPSPICTVAFLATLRVPFRQPMPAGGRAAQTKQLWRLVNDHNFCNKACALAVGQSSINSLRMARIRAAPSSEAACVHGLHGRTPANARTTLLEDVKAFLLVVTRLNPTTRSRYILQPEADADRGVRGLWERFQHEQSDVALGSFRHLVRGILAAENTLRLRNAEVDHNVCPTCKDTLTQRDQAASEVNVTTAQVAVAAAAAEAAAAAVARRAGMPVAPEVRATQSRNPIYACCGHTRTRRLQLGRGRLGPSPTWQPLVSARR